MNNRYDPEGAATAVGGATVSAQQHLRLGLPILATLARHWLVGWRLRASSRTIRTTNERALERAYESLSLADFAALNAPQQWLNARLMPRALRAHVVQQPLCIADLGCGTGESTQVLARWAPPNSRLIGYDLCETLLTQARRRAWHAARGEPLATAFIRQSLLDPLRDSDEQPLAPHSVDVVHAAGVVGHHLRDYDVVRLAAELRRVLAAGGIVILDSGPKLPPRRLTRLMEREQFDRTACHRLLPFASRAALVFRRKPGSPQ